MLTPESKRKGRLWAELAVFLAFAALTVAMTWPWAARIRDAVTGENDPYLNAWTLWWDWHATFHQPFHIFDANIFFPYRYSLAFSENEYGLALPFFALFALGVRPLTVHGLATLLGFAFSGYGAFRLTRTLTGSTAAAFVAGIGFAFTPYRFHLLPHANYIFAGWIPLLFEALVLFVTERTPRRAAWLGLAFFMNGLTCIHWLVLTLVPFAVCGFVAAVSERVHRDPAFWRRGILALGLAGLGLLPFLLPYQRAAKLYGFVRNEAETRFYSARLSSWLLIDPSNRLWHCSKWEGELCLAPGLLLALSSLVALVALRRTRSVHIGAILFALGFLGSLGMHTPYHRALFYLVPIFRSLRVPARSAMVAHLGLAVLAGAAIAILTRRARTWGGLALSAALLFELRAAPLHLVRGTPDADEITLHLAGTPMKGGLVALPLPSRDDNLTCVLRAADHGKPLVDAVSGFTPPIVAELERLLAMRPIPERLLDLLEEIPASYVTVRDAWLSPDERGALRVTLARGITSGRIRFVKRFPGRLRDELYAITKIETEVSGSPSPWDAARTAALASPLGREDPDLIGSVDEPAEEQVVAGTLFVRGWARREGEDLDVTVLLDGEVRTPASFQRWTRPDVCVMFPALAPCATAGYAFAFPFQPGDEGPREIRAVFRAADGRVRHYPPRRFVWNK